MNRYRAASNIVLAITGASGAVYAVRLLQVLLGAGKHVHLSISPAAVLVLRQELGVEVDLDRFEPRRLLFEADSRELRQTAAGAGRGARATRNATRPAVRFPITIFRT